MNNYDLAIIGSGPSGMAAASTATKYGLKTVIIDDQPLPGGQIYRALENTPVTNKAVLGKEYWYGKNLIDGLRGSKLEYKQGASVWYCTADGEIGIQQNQQTSIIQAKYIIVCTGAMERPFPIPGWTLPGVMTAGAAQTLLKSSGLTPESNVVLAGSGPLLLLLAAQYARLGVKINTILETVPKGRYSQALPYLPKALKNWSVLSKGLSLIRELKRSGVKIIRHVSALEALGNGSLNSVRWQRQGVDTWTSIETDTLLLHHGVVPNTQLARVIGCEHEWNETQLCWHPSRDELLQTTVKNVAVAGDSGGIVGAKGSELEGHLAALGAIKNLGLIKDKLSEFNSDLNKIQRDLAKEKAVRPFLDELYKPAKNWRLPADETIVCRCEEVNAGVIRSMAKIGSMGPNQTKAFSRCGMGPCQGRMCGLTVTDIMADTLNKSPAEIGYYRLRQPVKPINIGQLANLEDIS